VFLDIEPGKLGQKEVIVVVVHSLAELMGGGEGMSGRGAKVEGMVLLKVLQGVYPFLAHGLIGVYALEEDGSPPVGVRHHRQPVRSAPVFRVACPESQIREEDRRLLDDLFLPVLFLDVSEGLDRVLLRVGHVEELAEGVSEEAAYMIVFTIKVVQDRPHMGTLVATRVNQGTQRRRHLR
jgi:hypothetical protein